MAQQLNYSPNYSAARESFRTRAAKHRAVLDAIPLAARGAHGEPLSIDLAWIGPSTASAVLLYVSGVHGVEGFAGSALQCALLDDLPSLPEGIAVLMVHAVNPFGMSWLRRVNENNVDLNRNCLAPGERYEGVPPDYERLERLLNPRSPPPLMDGFYIRALLQLLRCGRARLAQGIAGGQYEHPHGLFFGGHQLEEGPRRLLEWLERRVKGIDRLLLLDVHTGLGRFAQDLLLVGYLPGSAAWESLRSRFGTRLRGPVGATYQVRGGFFDAVERAAAARRCWSIVHEFGTYSGLRVLATMRAENRLWGYGSREDLKHPIKQQLRNCFAPLVPAWQSAVFARGRDVFCQGLEILHQADGVTTRAMPVTGPAVPPRVAP